MVNVETPITLEEQIDMMKIKERCCEVSRTEGIPKRWE